jgi:hypothetical protein
VLIVELKSMHYIEEIKKVEKKFGTEIDAIPKNSFISPGNGLSQQSP